jgi:phage pi2 protein 07
MSQSDNFTIEELLQFSDSKLIMLALGDGNPGAYKVVVELFKVIELDETKNELIISLIKQLMSKNIVGDRLWYIYKNEAKLDIHNLIYANLDQFTDEYFYEKFEKYTKNL